MKTKILLTITVFILTFKVYADKGISIDSIQYAMQHPGIPIMIADSTYYEYSSNWLWETKYTTKQVIVYYGEECRFSSPFNQTIKSKPKFCWGLIVLFILGIIGSFFMKWEGYIPLSIITVLYIMFSNRPIYWWIPLIILSSFFIASLVGYWISKKKILMKT